MWGRVRGAEERVDAELGSPWGARHCVCSWRPQGPQGLPTLFIYSTHMRALPWLRLKSSSKHSGPGRRVGGTHHVLTATETAPRARGCPSSGQGGRQATEGSTARHLGRPPGRRGPSEGHDRHPGRPLLTTHAPTCSHQFCAPSTCEGWRPKTKTNQTPWLSSGPSGEPPLPQAAICSLNREKPCALPDHMPVCVPKSKKENHLAIPTVDIKPTS